MSMTSSNSKGPAAEINVTPLIDVLLVLLIIFMVIVPNAVHGLDALVPQPPQSPTQQNPDDPIIVQVLGDTQHGIIYKINETSFNRSDIEPKLAEIFATRSDKTIFIKGDATLDFSLVADVINSGHHAGINNIGIITPKAALQ